MFIFLRYMLVHLLYEDFDKKQLKSAPFDTLFSYYFQI